MALIPCPECKNECSSLAEFCPKCGYPFREKAINRECYETKVVKIRCWGRNPQSINAKLEPYITEGWEVVTMVEDRWQGGVLSPVYKVTLRRGKTEEKERSEEKTGDKINPELYKEMTENGVIVCRYCGYQIFPEEDRCGFCGKTKQ